MGYAVSTPRFRDIVARIDAGIAEGAGALHAATMNAPLEDASSFNANRRETSRCMPPIVYESLGRLARGQVI